MSLKEAAVAMREAERQLDEALEKALPGWSVDRVLHRSDWDEEEVVIRLQHNGLHTVLTPSVMAEAKEKLGADWIGHTGESLHIRWNLIEGTEGIAPNETGEA